MNLSPIKSLIRSTPCVVLVAATTAKPSNPSVGGRHRELIRAATHLSRIANVILMRYIGRGTVGSSEGPQRSAYSGQHAISLMRFHPTCTRPLNCQGGQANERIFSALDMWFRPTQQYCKIPYLFLVLDVLHPIFDWPFSAGVVSLLILLDLFLSIVPSIHEYH